MLPLIPAVGGVAVVILGQAAGRSENPNICYLVKALKSVSTLGSGNSLGPEKPCIDAGIYLSDVVSSKIDKPGSISSGDGNTMMATGIAAGVSGGFNAPVSGVFFAIETLRVGDFPAVSNLFLSSISSSFITHVLLRDDLAFSTPELFFGNPNPKELPFYIGLGTLSGLTSSILTLTTAKLQAIKEEQLGEKKLYAFAPIFAGLLTGLVGIFRPRVLFNGYDTLNSILANTLPLPILLQLFALKIITTSTATASGLVGGQLAPSLFIGATLGGAYHDCLVLSGLVPPESLSSAPTYALIGAASVLSAKFKAPVFGSVLLFELTRDYDVLFPLLGSAWVGTAVYERVMGRWGGDASGSGSGSGSGSDLEDKFLL